MRAIRFYMKINRFHSSDCPRRQWWRQMPWMRIISLGIRRLCYEILTQGRQCWEIRTTSNNGWRITSMTTIVAGTKRSKLNLYGLKLKINKIYYFYLYSSCDHKCFRSGKVKTRDDRYRRGFQSFQHIEPRTFWCDSANFHVFSSNELNFPSSDRPYQTMAHRDPEKSQKLFLFFHGEAIQLTYFRLILSLLGFFWNESKPG